MKIINGWSNGTQKNLPGERTWRMFVIILTYENCLGAVVESQKFKTEEISLLLSFRPVREVPVLVFC